jgi:hypothetical protein
MSQFDAENVDDIKDKEKHVCVFTLRDHGILSVHAIVYTLASECN